MGSADAPRVQAVVSRGVGTTERESVSVRIQRCSLPTQALVQLCVRGGSVRVSLVGSVSCFATHRSSVATGVQAGTARLGWLGTEHGTPITFQGCRLAHWCSHLTHRLHCPCSCDCGCKSAGWQVFRGADRQ